MEKYRIDKVDYKSAIASEYYGLLLALTDQYTQDANKYPRKFLKHLRYQHECFESVEEAIMYLTDIANHIVFSEPGWDSLPKWVQKSVEIDMLGIFDKVV